MIIIQLLLIIAILTIMVRFLASRNSLQTQAWKKIILILFVMSAVAFIIHPDLLNGIANTLGVGRGADLLLYALAVSFIFVQFNNYIKDKEDNKKIVTIARKLAILEALEQNKARTKE